MKKIKYFLNIRKLPFRFLLLLFSVGSGIGLVWVGADKIYCFFDSILAIEIKSNYSFIALLLGSLTFLTLWFFRTYDVREQIGQQDFHDALRMLADDKLISQEIAVLRLIDISKKNKIYDDTIKLAFIKRMKAPYETEKVKEAVEKAKEAAKKSQIKLAKFLIAAFQQVERRTYAQYIFRWLGERYRVEDKLDLVGLDLSCQDFRDEDNKRNKIKHFRTKKGKYFVLDFVNLTGADLTRVDLTGVKLNGSNLTGVDLTRADLTEAKLILANLTGADLARADLIGANLTRADLTEAILTVANLTRADLRGADLTRADLRGADLTGADLTGANLTGADLREADLREAVPYKGKLLGLTGAKGLTYNQLASVKSLYEAKGLETVLKPEELTRLRAEKPELFEPPKEEQNEIKI